MCFFQNFYEKYGIIRRTIVSKGLNIRNSSLGNDSLNQIDTNSIYRSLENLLFLIIARRRIRRSNCY